MAQQEHQQLESLRLDRQCVAVAEQAMTGDVDLDTPEVDDRRRVLGRDRLLGASEQGPDPRRQLTHAERLGHVVVRPELQADDLVDLRILRGEHDDRNARLGSDDPADLDPRQLGQHQVEQDKVRPLRPEDGQRRATVGGRDDPESLCLERVDERLAEGRPS